MKKIYTYTVEPHYNGVLGTIKITLLYQVSHNIRVKTNKYKELGPANLPCYKRVLSYPTSFHCTYPYFYIWIMEESSLLKECTSLHQPEARSAFSLFNYVPLRTRRAPSPDFVHAAIAPFWFSPERHLLTAIMPFWLSTDN